VEKKVQVGTKTVYDRVPAYEWQKVQTGWREPDPPEPTSTPEPKNQDQGADRGELSSPEEIARYRERMNELLYYEGGEPEGKQTEMMNEPPPWDSEMSRFGGSEDSIWNEKLREVAKEMGLVSSSVPPPWDDELSRLGELEDEEGYEFVPQENYQVLYDETLDVYAKYSSVNFFL
jgi:hypothetical protein